MNSDADALTALLDAAETHAQHVLVDSGQDELLPLFHLCGPDGDILVATPFCGDESKDFAAHGVRQLIRQHRITRYSFLSEAWMIKRKSYLPGLGPRPSEADDRVEVVIATATDGVAHRYRRWRIKRDGTKCVALVRDDAADEVPAKTHGRFDNLFARG
jgi:hypothetical protein